MTELGGRPSIIGTRTNAEESLKWAFIFLIVAVIAGILGFIGV